MVNDSEFVPQDEDDGTVDPFEQAKKQMLITLDAVEYPCTSWESTAQGQRLVIKWPDGFAEGMNHHEYHPEGYVLVQNVDVTQKPYVRLRPAYAATVSIAALDMAFPVYTFRHKGSTTDMLFVLNGTNIFKIKLSDNTLASTKALGGSAVCGRPALWKGKWHIPLGPSVNPLRLDTTTNDGVADTYADQGNTFATHYLSGMIKDGVRQLTRSLAADVYITESETNGSWGSAFPVGDSSNDITDLLLWQGEAAICKTDSVFKFSLEATSEAFPIFQFEQRASISTIGVDTYLGSRSTVHGALLYFAHRNLHRAVGNATITVGPDSDTNRMHFTWDSFKAFVTGGTWEAIETWGRNIYAVFSNQVFHGEIQTDGTVRWFGVLFEPTASGTVSLAIEEGEAVSGAVSPVLWLFDGDNAYRVTLDDDGSPRTQIGSGSRGKASENGLFIMPSVHMGEEIGQDLSDVRKQLRRVGCIIEGGTRTNIDIKFNVFRDGTGTSQNIGNAAATQADGLFEASPTVGTNDLFHYIMLYVKFEPNGSYSPSDPRFRAPFIEAVTPMIYEATIELSPGLTGTSNSPEGARKLIRDVTHKRIAIREPGSTGTFLGYVRKIREETFKTEPPHSRLGIRLFLEIERFDWSV